MVFALTTQETGPPSSRSCPAVEFRGARHSPGGGTTVGYVSVAATYIWGDVVFNFLVNSYGAVALFVNPPLRCPRLSCGSRAERNDPAPP